jgi:hypothetical protein
MGSVPPLLTFLLAVVSGWVHRRQRLVIEFLQAENRMFKDRVLSKYSNGVCGRLSAWDRSRHFLTFRLAVVSGLGHRGQLLVIEFLQVENRMLKDRRRGKRIRFTDAERAFLARRSKAIELSASRCGPTKLGCSWSTATCRR